MIRVKVQVSKGVNEVTGLESANLRHHQREQRITAMLNGTPRKYPRCAGKADNSVRLHSRKLKHRVTGRQRHAVDVSHIPGTDDQPTAVGIGFDLLNYLGDLVNAPFAFSQSPSDGSDTSTIA
jgi:hypothetical protein